MSYTYIKGVTLGPAMTFTWLDTNGNIRDFSTGWTFTARIAAASAPGVTLETVPTGRITGAATAPNVTVDFATDDHDTLTAGGATYVVLLVATPAVGDPIAFSPAKLPTFRLNTAPAP